jgi:hypothetical protein
LKRSRLKLPRGIIKIKKGYNPNSSSIGTVVYSFPLVAAGVGAVIALIAVFLKRPSGINSRKDKK